MRLPVEQRVDGDANSERTMEIYVQESGLLYVVFSAKRWTRTMLGLIESSGTGSTLIGFHQQMNRVRL